MGKYSLVKQNKRAFNKTLAIALAAGVSFGGVTIPQFTGAESVTAVASAAESETISPASPFPEVKETTFDREYKLADAKPGSHTLMRVLASSADVQNGKIVIPELFAGVSDDKILSINGSYDNNGEPFVREEDYPSSVEGTKSIRVEENGDFVISLLPGAKRFAGYIAVILSDHTTLIISPAAGTREHAGLNFVTKNSDGTISGELEKRHMSHLTASGATHEFGAYGFPLLGQEPDVEVEPSDFDGSDAGKFIAGGVVARIPEQGVWKIDNDAGTIKFTPEPGFDGTPTFPRIGLVDIFNASGLIYTPAQSQGQDTDVAPLPDVMKQYTFIDMQYVMPEEYRKEAEKDPDFNPNIPVEPETPAEDLHVTNVEKDNDGNYVVTRSDGKTWTIELKDIRDKLAELDKKETVSPEDLKQIKDDLNKAKDDIKDLKGEDDKLQDEIDKVNEELDNLTPRVDKLEDRVKNLEDSAIKEVRDNGDGTYTIIRNDGTEVPGTIGDGQDITKIVDNGDGSITVTRGDNKTEKIDLTHTEVTETGKGTTDHKITIKTPDGKSFTFDAYDNYVTEVKREKNGDYTVTRNDGEKWTIELSDIRNDIKNLKGKDAEQDKKLTELENKLNDADSKLVDLAKQISENKGAIEQNRGSIDKIDKDLGSVENDVKNIKVELNDLKERVSDLEDSAIKNVRDNGDGTYTIIRNNGDEVEGTIGNGQDIEEIKPNTDGTITIVRENGDESKVDLKQVTIKEENKGTPNHTVTITSPNGDSVTFNVFDKYVTNVVKNENGDYDIFRSDIDGGKTVWKTIVLSDLRDKISNLENRADKLEKKDQALQDEIDELKDRMGKAEDNIKGLQDKTEGLEDDVRKINAHLSTLDLRVSAIDAKLAVLEGRVNDLEDTNKKWAECYSGIGMAAIPLAIAAPLAGLANMDIPFLNQANTDIQKRLGVYNPDLAKAWGQYGGIMKAVAGLVGLMGAIGAITYAGNQCNPYNQTDDVKDTKLGKLSSKFESAKAESSFKK